MKSSELKELIRASFVDTPCPEGKLTDSDYDEGISEFFSGRKWHTFEVKELRRYCAALSLLKPKAFRYFLPAFMLAELVDPEGADVIGQFIVYGFGEPKKFWSQTYEERISCFTSPEKKAILEFLDYMQETYGCFGNEIIYASGRLCG